MSNSNYFELIRNWAEARNLINGSDSFRQMTKLVEEMGELAHGIAKNRPDEVMDGIGDMVVVLTILAAQNDITIEQCIAMAWDEIKDRTGCMIDGIFVKEADMA
jgi:NTP pyrophosphatase (non-canonical NTP hydrolase)